VWPPVIFEIFPVSIANNYLGTIGGDISHFSVPISVQLPDKDPRFTKGPKQEIFVAELFVQSKPVWVDDLGT
jgi:hypothetical protein